MLSSKNEERSESDLQFPSPEQVVFNKHRNEIKQISGLVILSCGLGIAEKKTCSQIMQENDFFSSFEKVYEKLCNDVIIGSRVKKIPLHYSNIGIELIFIYIINRIELYVTWKIIWKMRRKC